MAEINAWSVPKDENGNAYYSYRKVTYWINSTENFKYIIKGDLDYRPDIIEGKPVPVASEFTDWKTGIKYIKRNDGWAILPGSGGGGGGDITRDEVIAFDAEVLKEAKSYTDSKTYTPVIIEVDENQTINEYQVPKLTKDDLLRAYNGVVAGYPVVIVDATKNYFFVVKQADTDTDNQFVCFDFCATMILTYELHKDTDEVTTDYKEIGSGGGEPAQYLKSINKTETETATEITISDKTDTATSFIIPKGGSGGGGDIWVDSLYKIDDYLYEIEIADNDYAFANEFFKSLTDDSDELVAGGCTTVIRAGIMARNYDWLYDNTVSFVVNTRGLKGYRPQSKGMAGGYRNMARRYVEERKFDEKIKLIPFFTTDGCNEHGVCVSTHVINTGDYAPSDVILPSYEEKVELASLMVPRYILDNFTSADEAVAYIKAHAKVYHPRPLLAQGYYQQFIVTDSTENTYVLEPKNGKYEVSDKLIGAYTNFQMHQATPGDDGHFYTNWDIPEGKDPGSQTKYQHFAMGIERYNIAWDKLIRPAIALIDIEKIKSVMINDLKYTNLYDSSDTPGDPAWLSDYIDGVNGLTQDSSHPEAFDTIRAAAATAFTNRDRDTAETWQTVHTSIYDFANDTFYVATQEQEKWFEMKIKTSYDVDKKYIDDQDAATLDAAKSYANDQDAATLDAAKEYADDTKVPKVEGKQLSTNDYTDDDKNKLSGIEVGAEVNPAQFLTTIVKSTEESKVTITDNNGVEVEFPINTEEGVTKEYVDGQDTEVLNAAKEYADSKVKEYTGGDGIEVTEENVIKVNASAVYGSITSIACSSSAWTTLSGKDPYTHVIEVSLTDITANTVIELKNTDPVLFYKHGFVLAPNQTAGKVKFWSIGKPDSNVTLEVHLFERGD